MKRRDFLTGAALTWLPALAIADLAMASPAGDIDAPLYLDSKRLSPALLAHMDLTSMRVMAVDADVTPVWNSELRNTMTRSAAVIAGITTRSFLFCLENLARDHAQVSVQKTRVSKDLLYWRMTTRPITRSGAAV